MSRTEKLGSIKALAYPDDPALDHLLQPGSIPQAIHVLQTEFRIQELNLLRSMDSICTKNTLTAQGVPGLSVPRLHISSHFLTP